MTGFLLFVENRDALRAIFEELRARRNEMLQAATQHRLNISRVVAQIGDFTSAVWDYLDGHLGVEDEDYVRELGHTAMTSLNAMPLPEDHEFRRLHGSVVSALADAMNVKWS